MSRGATALLLLVSSAGLASSIAAATSLALHILICVSAVLFILLASVSAWCVIVNSLLASQRVAPLNSIIIALRKLFGGVLTAYFSNHRADHGAPPQFGGLP
jgi:hypothetical protein